MKNKHLVLLFLAILVGGYLLRNFPFLGGGKFEREIIRLDPAAIRQVLVQAAGDSLGIEFSKSDSVWFAAHGHRTVAVSLEKIEPLLASLASVRAMKMLHQVPENQHFKGQATRLQIFSEKKKLDDFWLGPCAPGQTSATLARIFAQPEAFEIDGRLACLWQLNFDDFRNRNACPAGAAFRSVEFVWPDFSPLFFEKLDERWQTPGGSVRRSEGEMTAWLSQINSLKINEFADDFDDSRLHQTLVGKMTLSRSDAAGAMLELQCFRSEQLRPRFVLRSSENPDNFFYVADSLAQSLFLAPQHWSK